MKIVINVCHGGYGLSAAAQRRFTEITGKECELYGEKGQDARNDPALVRVVEELKEFANDSHALLKIVDIPDDVAWQIEEYDGREWVAEQHRTWG